MTNKDLKIIFINSIIGFGLLFILGFWLFTSHAFTGKNKVETFRDPVKKTIEERFKKEQIFTKKPGRLSLPEATPNERQRLNPNHYFTSVAERAIPRVVAIFTESKNKSGFFDFFKDNTHPDIPVHGKGSGTIIDSSGLILTNYHVVKNAGKISVKIKSLPILPGKLVGVDPATDLALIRVNTSKNLPYFDLSRSQLPLIGEWVIAVGNPLSFNGTVTAGIVSAKNRQINIINESFRVENFIQTDAVINPGNSGGPLLNINGDLVGINTAIASRTGLYEGFGFAVPSDIIRRVVDDLITFGKVKRGLLGIRIGGISGNFEGDDSSVGVKIVSVQKERAAFKAGLKANDIILALNDTPVTTTNDLQVFVNHFHPGDSIWVLIKRAGKKLKKLVVLEEMNLEHFSASDEKTKENTMQVLTNPFNIQTRDLTEEEKNKFDLGYGIVVEESHEKLGLMKNDILLRLNDHKLFSPQNFNILLNLFKNNGDSMKVKILRNEDEYQKLLSLVLN